MTKHAHITSSAVSRSLLVAIVVPVCMCSMSRASAFQQARQLTAAPHTYLYRARSTSLANASDGGPTRRTVLGAGLFGGMFGSGGGASAASAAGPPTPPPSSPGSTYKPKGKGPTNEVVKVVHGMKRRRLGGSDIVVSELGLGTQRWVSLDHNAPDEKLCFDFMDEAIVKSGVNLLDTAEQYPIPSGGGSPEGSTEECIGKWLKACFNGYLPFGTAFSFIRKV